MQAGKVELDLPIEVAGLVVGKKGVTINAIKASSKAHVQLSALPLPDNPKCKRLTISGSSKRDVDDAKDQVVQILASWCGIGSSSGEVQSNLELLSASVRSAVLASRRGGAKGRIAQQQQNGHQAPQPGAQALQRGSRNQDSASQPEKVQHTAQVQQHPPAQSVPHYAAAAPGHDENRALSMNSHYYAPGANLSAGMDRSRGPQMNAPPPPVPVPEMLRAGVEAPRHQEVEVPRACISYIVGKDYERVKDMESTSGAQIFPVEVNGSESPGFIRIAFVGTETAVFKAKSMLIQVSGSSFDIAFCVD